MPFVYDLDAQRSLVDSLTTDRLTSYLAATKGDIHQAIRLYEYNTRASESLYGVTQALEITCRNACHRAVTNGTGRADWYDHVGFDAKEVQAIGDATKNILRWRKMVTPGRVIAELTFGFWVRLFAPQYEKRLWVKYLYKAFPHNGKPDRIATFNRMEHIRKLRNRIAHHEPIFARDLAKDYDDIIEAIGWMCPVTRTWVECTNSFAQRGFC